MSIKLAMWLGGNGVQAEFAPLSQRRMAGSGLFGGVDVSTNFFHFPISTPVIVDDRRPLLTRAFVLYRMKFCAVQSMQLWSGRERRAVFDVTQEAGDVRTHADVDRNQFVEGKTMFSMLPLHGDPIEMSQGLTITVKVKFDSRLSSTLAGIPIDSFRQLGVIEFYSAGADFE
jgi:hypothetical protein